MRTFIPYLLILLLLAAGVWAMSFGTLPPADFTFCNGDEIKTLDPAIVTGSPEGRLIRGLLEGLSNWHPQTLRPIPGVAENIYTVKDEEGEERWACLSEDGLTYTFKLRQDALWSDGSPVTAHDFHYSFRRFLHPETAAEYAYEMWYVRGAQAYSTIKLKAGDAVEVELLDKPEGALPFAPGKLLHGTLVKELPEDKTYLVEIDGKQHKYTTSEASDAKECKWVLPDFDKTVAINVLDDYTLEIQLKHPTPYFLNLMGFYPMFPVNRKCVETYGRNWVKPGNMVGNGPFVLESRRIRDRVRMVKNPLYWNRDEVHLQTVDALAVPSDTTALNLYMTGQADWIITVPGAIVPELMKRKDFQPEPYLATYYYRLNVTRPPLNDVHVRRALALAMNRREIVEKITRAGQQPAYSYVPRELSKYVDYDPPQLGKEDPEEARRLLAEAGYPGGRGFPKNLEILFNSSEAHENIALLVQSQWKRELGIDVRLQSQEWGAYQSAQRTLEYRIGRAAWIGDYLDPNTFLDMFVTGGANNQTGWSNPQYDRLLEQAQMEADPQLRLKLFHQAETILMEDLPIIPVYYYVSLNMVRPYVKGFYQNLQSVHPLQGVWIDEEEKARILSEER